MPLTPEDVERLSPQERLDLIGQLWDSLEDGDIPLSAAQQAELESRMASFEQDRGRATPWHVLHEELRRRSG